MKRICDFCEAECDESVMEPVNLGRRKLWKCPECYKTGHREAAMFDFTNKKKITKKVNTKTKL